MSLETETALAGGWPVEVTEFAVIGDAVAEELNQGTSPVEEGSPLDPPHFGWVVWNLDEDALPVSELLSSSVPGQFVADRVSDRVSREFARLYADVGFYEQPLPIDILVKDAPGVPSLPAWVPRPCVGDPRLDPWALEEGAMVPWLHPGAFWDGSDPRWVSWANTELDNLEGQEDDQTD
jgi:hypothetical protein